MTEVEFLKSQIEDLSGKRAVVAENAKTHAAQVDAQIREWLTEAGLWDKIQALQTELRQTQLVRQERVAGLDAQIHLLRAIHDKFHIDPVAPGTMIHGIDVSKLDWETRLRVRNGERETIAMLGGKLDEPTLPGFDVPTLVQSSDDSLDEASSAN
jgi:hypothetical protein